MKIKTFTQSLEALHVAAELDELDRQVNEFIKAHGVSKVISVSDTTTVGGDGTIGIIRVLAYED